MAGLAAAGGQAPPRADVSAAVDALVEAGYVEDAAAPVPGSFSAGELERYKRNADFLSFFSPPSSAPTRCKRACRAHASR